MTVSREQFAAGCSDGSILFWDAATFAARSSLNGHTGAVLGLAFDGDGTRLVSGGEDGTVQVWNLADQKSVWKEKLHAEAVNAVTFSPNGASVASASYDHTARLTDAVTGEEIRVLVGHTAPLRSVAFSPDGSRLATSAGDATARIWRIETGREVLRLAGHTGWVHSVAVSHDGRQIATGGLDKTVRLWDANVTKEIVQISGQDSDLYSLGVSPEGGRIAVGGQGRSGSTMSNRDRKNFASDKIAAVPASLLSAPMDRPSWRQPTMELRTSGRPAMAAKSCASTVAAQVSLLPHSTLAAPKWRRSARKEPCDCGTSRPGRRSAAIRRTMTSCSTWRSVPMANCWRPEADPEQSGYSKPAPQRRRGRSRLIPSPSTRSYSARTARSSQPPGKNGMRAYGTSSPAASSERWPTTAIKSTMCASVMTACGLLRRLAIVLPGCGTPAIARRSYRSSLRSTCTPWPFTLAPCSSR